jgi:hypothetical protein
MVLLFTSPSPLLIKEGSYSYLPLAKGEREGVDNETI